MKTLLLSLTAALALGTSAFADDKDKDKPKGDLGKLQGKWTTKLGPIDITLVIDGKGVTAKGTSGEGQEFEIKGEINVDDAAKPEKTIDWVKFKHPNGDDMGDNKGIYAFENDDTVKICNGGPGNDRPTGFKAGEAGGPNLFTLKREGAKKDEPKEELKGDLAKVQGTWTAMVGPEKSIPLTVAIKGKSVSLAFVTPEGDERTMKGELVLDEAAKPHKSITWRGFKRPDGEDAPENLGIYALEGDDTLKICSGGPGNDRPTEFKSGDGGPPMLTVFTRKK